MSYAECSVIYCCSAALRRYCDATSYRRLLLEGADVGAAVASPRLHNQLLPIHDMFFENYTWCAFNWLLHACAPGQCITSGAYRCACNCGQRVLPLDAPQHTPCRSPQGSHPPCNAASNGVLAESTWSDTNPCWKLSGCVTGDCLALIHI